MEILFFGLDVSGWAQGGALVVIAGAIIAFARKRKINLKAIFSRAAVITKEIGEAFLATSNAFDKADNAIKEDNKLIENSVKDVIEAGKEAVLEWTDVIVTIKPKK
jgi:hypothetical protein